MTFSVSFAVMIKIDVGHLEEISKSDSDAVRCQHHRALTGVSSPSPTEGEKGSCNIEIEVNQVEELAIITELDIPLEKPNCNETFAVPNAKHCNAIIRFVVVLY